MPSHRELTVILFCDIEGYSALMQESESKALAILNHYHEVLQIETKQYGGTIVKNYGDGSLCLFGSAINAVQCAIQIQKSLKNDPEVPLRIGIHVGDIVHKNDDVYGDGINVASRLEQNCVPGGIVFSRSIYNELKNQDSFKSIHLGKFSFKNIQEDVDVYTLDVEGINVSKSSDFKRAKIKTARQKMIVRLSSVVVVIILVLISAFTVFKSGNDYFGERGWVLLMPLENKTDEANLSGSLDNAIRSGIQQSGYINILPQSRIQQTLQRMGRSSNDSVDLETAKEIAIREGAHVIVKGYIEKVGDNYLLTAQIINPETEIDLYRTTVRARNSTKILNATDQLINKIRKGLGESLISRIEKSKSLPAATTNSLSALKYFSDGSKFWYSGQYDEAIEMYKKAYELDSNFVWVRVGMGMYYYYIEGDKPKSEIHFRYAELNLNRVTVKEELWLTALIASLREELSKSILASKGYLSEFPDDHAAWYLLGNIYKKLKRYDEAILAYEKALQINPSDYNSLINIATVQNIQNHFENSYEYYNRAFEIMPQYRVSNNLNHEFGFLLVNMDSIESAKQNFELMLQGDDKHSIANGHRSLALLDMYQGKLKSAVEHLQECIEYRSIVNNGLSLARDRMYLTSAYIMQGSLEEAKGQLAEVDQISQNTYMATHWLRNWGSLCIQMNNIAKAQEINRLLESRIYPQNEADKSNHQLLTGNILIMTDSVEEGIELLESALRLNEDSYNKGHLANAYFKLDKMSVKAENLFKEIINSQDLGWEAQELYLTSYLRLAEIYENKGEIDESIKYYREFLTLWKNADYDLALIHQIENKIKHFDIQRL